MNILIITDTLPFYISLKEYLSKNDYRVIFSGKQEDILSLIKKKDIRIIIMDLTLKEIQDFALLKLIKNFDPLMEVVIIGNSTTSDKIGESIRLGASEYLIKPLKINHIESVFKKINDKIALRRETLQLEKELNGKCLFEHIIGKNPHMLDIFSLIERIAKHPTNILITGKTGTGKEMVVKAIHNLSPRRKKKLVTLDCTALPETLFESELFGYVRGAFTGADKTKKGLFEEANSGTLFLDEIGNLPVIMQSKLLRVLEEREFRRLGSTENIHLDIRLISATSRDLKIGIKNETFREDLFHRLNTVEIRLPDLKDRIEDIPLLIRHFLGKYTKNFNKRIGGMSRQVQKILLNHDWPGNVRELENVIEHSVAICPKQFINIEDLPEYIQKQLIIDDEIAISEFESFLSLEKLEKQQINRVVEATNRNIQHSAQILGISRYTLYRKLKSINGSSSLHEG